MKKVLCMLIMTIAIGIMGGGTRTYADEIKDNSEIEEQYFEILAYDAENNRSLAVLSTHNANACLLYTSPSPRDGLLSRMPSSA